MAKQIDQYLKLQIPANGASPSPPVGPALGQAGIPIMDFCKAFNAQTQDLEAGCPVPVVITVFEDKSFEFVTKTPPASYYLKKAAGIKKGSGEPNKVKVGRVTIAQLKEIAEAKKVDLNSNDEEAAIKIIAGSARAMGLEVEGMEETMGSGEIEEQVETPANTDAPAQEANEAPAEAEAPAEEATEAPAEEATKEGEE